MTALIQSGEFYSNNFSSVVRVSRTAELSVEAIDQDGSGRDPLPAYLKDSRIDINAKTATVNHHDMGENSSGRIDEVANLEEVNFVTFNVFLFRLL